MSHCWPKCFPLKEGICLLITGAFSWSQVLALVVLVNTYQLAQNQKITNTNGDSCTFMECIVIHAPRGCTAVFFCAIKARGKNCKCIVLISNVIACIITIKNHGIRCNSITLCMPRGWYLFLTKMSTRYKNACQAFSLQQNPMKPYIFRERIKYTFTSIIEIMGYIKIVTS